MKEKSWEYSSVRTKWLTVLLSAILLWAALPGATLAEAMTVRFMNDDGVWYSYEMDFTNSVFGRDSGSYQPELARMSISLAVSAFRDWEMPDRKQHLGEEFLTQAGFTDIRSWDYEGDPTPDTIGLLIGRKEIDGRTVVAMAPSGEYYQREWVSNLHVGDMTSEKVTRHEGFHRAAEKVFERLMNYIRNITGEWVLWGAGFSRSGAVANITAAMLLQQEILPPDRVYVYTCASPGHTVLSGEEQESGLYRGCWNLISPYDLISNFIPSSWGFVRYGHTVPLPDHENAKQQKEAARNAEAWSRAHFGVEWYQNDLVPMLRNVLDSLLSRIAPTPEDYIMTFQEALRENMRESEQISEVISDLISDEKSDAEESDSGNVVMKLIRSAAESVFGMSIREYISMCVQQGHRPRSYIPVVMGNDLIFGE